MWRGPDQGHEEAERVLSLQEHPALYVSEAAALVLSVP